MHRPTVPATVNAALLALARGGALTMGRRIAVADIDPTSIAELRADGLIREVRPGHTVAFTHDIYFEWAFLHLLHRGWRRLDRGPLRAVGEPPVLGRVVELLSQYILPVQADWDAYLAAIEASDLRPQWRRAWLLGPFHLPAFADFAAAYTAVILQPQTQKGSTRWWSGSRRKRPGQTRRCWTERSAMPAPCANAAGVPLLSHGRPTSRGGHGFSTGSWRWTPPFPMTTYRTSFR